MIFKVVREEEDLRFLVCDYNLVNRVAFVGEVKYAESVWTIGRGERGRSALYSGCVYIPTDGSGVATIDDREYILTFKQKGKVVLLGDFNARVGKFSEVDDVMGMFGGETCNASGNKLISLLNEVELVVCNGRKLVVEPKWTRVRPSLKRKSIIDYIMPDGDSRKASGDVHVDFVDIGCSDHFLVWMKPCKFTKNLRRIIKKCLGRLKHQKALEVKGFSRHKMSKGFKGHALVGYVLREWEHCQQSS